MSSIRQNQLKMDGEIGERERKIKRDKLRLGLFSLLIYCLSGKSTEIRGSQLKC